MQKFIKFKSLELRLYALRVTERQYPNKWYKGRMTSVHRGWEGLWFVGIPFLGYEVIGIATINRVHGSGVLVKI